MVAVTALILRLGEAVSNRVCGKQHSIKIIGRPKEAGSIGIIGGADGPTAIFISGRANPQAVSNVFSRLAGVVKAAGIGCGLKRILIPEFSQRKTGLLGFHWHTSAEVLTQRFRSIQMIF